MIIASSQTNCNSVQRENEVLEFNHQNIHFSESDVCEHVTGESQENFQVSENSGECSQHSVVIFSSSSPRSHCSDIPENSQVLSSETEDDGELVPSKLLSLSLSLLVAAFFQAIRCLQELIEDTFRTLHCDLDVE